MNKVNDYEALLKLANEDLASVGKQLVLDKDKDDGSYSVLVHDDRDQIDCFAEGYYEDELGELINDAWVHAKAGPKRPKTQNEKEDEIRTLINRLSAESRAELLAELYETLPDYWKDKFLELTGNN